jgi:ribosomal protein S18 acetylase RimI-like enzyme
MVRVEPPFRRATPEDAHELAELVNFASEGLALYLWTEMAGPGGDAWQVGRQRARRETGSFSYRNAIVAELDGRVVASLVGYPLADQPIAIDANMPSLFVPLQQLENLALGTWYVNVLAVYPQHRGKGLGTSLLALAETLAEDTGRLGLSVIVSDANTRARRLYQRCGYDQIAERAMVKEGWESRGRNWVLLMKRLSTMAV